MAKFRFTEKHLENFHIEHLVDGKPCGIGGSPELVKELNDAIEEHEKTLPVVYGDNFGTWGPLDDEGRDTHKALLFAVESIDENKDG